MSTGERPLKTVSAKNKLPFVPPGFLQSSTQYDFVLYASYDNFKSFLQSKSIFTAQCGISEECREYVPAFGGKASKIDKRIKTGCCVGLYVNFMLPYYDLRNSELYTSENLKVLFKNSSDTELSKFTPLGPPNLLTVSYSNEIIISIIYDSNFENKTLELYHPFILQIKNKALTIVLPKTNGNVQNIDI